jgi:hypothetical protein
MVPFALGRGLHQGTPLRYIVQGLLTLGTIPPYGKFPRPRESGLRRGRWRIEPRCAQSCRRACRAPCGVIRPAHRLVPPGRVTRPDQRVFDRSPVLPDVTSFAGIAQEPAATWCLRHRRGARRDPVAARRTAALRASRAVLSRRQRCQCNATPTAVVPGSRTRAPAVAHTPNCGSGTIPHPRPERTASRKSLELGTR